MNILISGTTYYPSMNGQAIFTVNLAEGLAARGHAVTVLYPSDRQQAYRSDAQRASRLEHVRSIQLSRFHPNAWMPIRFAQRRFGDLRHGRPDVLHIQDHYLPSGLMVQEAEGRGVRIMGTNHFMPENVAPYFPGACAIKPLFNWLLWKGMLHIYNRTEVVTAQSRCGRGSSCAHRVCARRYSPCPAGST